jgi:hypothetical protein
MRILLIARERLENRERARVDPASSCHRDH